MLPHTLRLRAAPVRIATLIFVSLLTALLMLPTGAATAASAPASGTLGDIVWGIRPADNGNGTGRPNFAYGLEPGSSVQDALVVTNRSDEQIVLRVYAADGFTNPSGNLDLVTSDAASEFVGAWTSTEVDTLTLAPGEAQEVEFTLTVPQDARPGDHAGGIITSLVSQEQGGNLVVDHRLSSRLAVRVSGPLTTAAQIDEVQIEASSGLNPFAQRPVMVSYTLTNTGNVRMYGEEQITIRGAFGMTSTTVGPAQTPELLPGDSVRRTLEVEAGTPLRATASLSLQPVGVGIGGGTIAEVTGSASTWTIPWVGLVVLLLLVAGGVWFWLRRRKQRPEPVAGSVTTTEVPQHEGSA